MIDIGRKLATGLLLFGAGSLILRKPHARIEECISDGICTRCSSLSECGLPQALSAKHELGG